MEMEYKVEIGGEAYAMDELMAVSITQPLFEKFSVGNACAAELTVEFIPHGSVPRMAKIVPYCRENDAVTWAKLGEFFLDERSRNGIVLKLTAYDAMLKAGLVWEPDQSLTFPMPMPDAVNIFCNLMGVELDSRTVLNSAYTIDYPANDYTVRDILRYIAAAHGGNWIITADGKLLLVPLFDGMPGETNYLITESGSSITFGDVRILV